MEYTHTPGPWKTGRALNTTGSVKIVHRGHLTLAWASCEDVSDITRDEAMANASLIAAAPDLLAALRDMVATWEGPRELAAIKFAQNVIAARAAIAKAEGK